jgi:DnaK suppressor protein
MSPAKKASARKSTAKKKASTTAATKGSRGSKSATPKASATGSAAAEAASKKTTATSSPRATAVKASAAASAKKKTSVTTASKKRPTKATAPRAADTRARPRAAKFDKAQLRAIRKQLSEDLGDLERQMKELEESSFDGNQSDVTGEVGLDDDFADAGSATFERERDLSIQNNVRDLIDQTTRAIERIDEGAYGMCERCGRPIDAARLKALPHALLCMDCKRREERAR